MGKFRDDKELIRRIEGSKEEHILFFMNGCFLEEWDKGQVTFTCANSMGHINIFTIVSFIIICLTDSVLLIYTYLNFCFMSLEFCLMG